MFGARAGAGEWADSPAAWPVLEPTQSDLGRKGTEVNLSILPPSFAASLGPSLSLENEVKARGRHSRDLPHHSSACSFRYLLLLRARAHTLTLTLTLQAPDHLPSPPLTPPATSAQDFCKSHSDPGAADEGVVTGFWLGLGLEGGISLSLSSWKRREQHDY